jgi:hypothetical protein
LMILRSAQGFLSLTNVWLRPTTYLNVYNRVRRPFITVHRKDNLHSSL